MLPKKFQQAINGIGVEQQRLLSQPFELSLPHDAYDVTDSNGGTPHLVIDLAAPDEILVKDFQRTLDAVRAAYQWPEPTHFALTEATRSWIEFRVLPYFDLNLWSLEMGVKIPQQVYGEALFPNEPGVGLGDRVRRTVRLKAREVVSGQMVESLRLQAAAT